MTGEVLGGGMLLALSAVLWVLYLVPAWAKRREYAAAERNALRLQRTLRVLAETAEVPGEVRLEATAKEALAHERLLASAEKRRKAEHEAELTAARIEERKAQMVAESIRQREARLAREHRKRSPWMRRVRSLTALIMFVGLLAILAGAVMAILGNGATLLGAGALATTVGFGVLLLIAPGNAPGAAAPAPLPKAAPRAENLGVAGPLAHDTAESPSAEGEDDSREDRSWTPRATPAPRYQQAHPEARLITPTHEHLLRQARSQALAAQRAEEHSRLRQAQAGNMADAAQESAPESSALPAGTAPRVSAPPAAARRPPKAGSQRVPRVNSRLQQMGIVDDEAVGQLDLDAAIRRRRNAS